MKRENEKKGGILGEGNCTKRDETGTLRGEELGAFIGEESRAEKALGNVKG